MIIINELSYGRMIIINFFQKLVKNKGFKKNLYKKLNPSLKPSRFENDNCFTNLVEVLN